MIRHLLLLLSAALLASCLSEAPEGIAPSRPAATTVKLDFEHRPLPELPLPIDLATRHDSTSATGRRINASMVAPTRMESQVRTLLDQQDGWGVFQTIAIPFTGPLDVGSILAGHREPNFFTRNDVVYLVNVDRDSPEFGAVMPLDIGNGAFPMVLEDRGGYWRNDPRGDTSTIFFEEVDEDLNGNGLLDPGEDTDTDGVLDRPNYFPGATPAPDDLAARADATMTFYERETNTLLVRPMEPLAERTTYAVIVTRRLLDEAGQPVGSPYAFVNHAAQTTALEPLLEVLPAGVGVDELAFVFSFTTQTIASSWVAVRDGLYGHGVQAHLGRDFPAQVEALEPLVDGTGDSRRPHLVPGEDFKQALEAISVQLLGQEPDSLETAYLLEGLDYIDYVVVGRMRSPQLFDRVDAEGNPLGLNQQSWPVDLDRVPAKARAEDVWFTLAVPRKEISARGEGKPAPVVILGHGYGSSRFEAATFAGHFARQGLATLAIDCVSHGISVDEETRNLATIFLSGYGLEPFARALFLGRAFDQNGDGTVDSGADFWTGYLFHTRDLVRQSALDYLQLVRLLRSFDGTSRFRFDTSGDGQPDLAGDFDGDGEIDVGGDGVITMTGASLGGIMASVLGGIEPELAAVAPIAGGGALGDIGIRSIQGGVREAVVLRLMGPLWLGTPDGAGQTRLTTAMPDLNDYAERDVGSIPELGPGDIMVVENGTTGERGCGTVQPDGKLRASVAADLGDSMRLLFFGPRALSDAEECEVAAGHQPGVVVETFAAEVAFQGKTFAAGSPLVALAEGLGLRRATPDLRRFMALGQLVLDGGDPAVFARHFQKVPIHFPGTGQTTGAHALVISSVGDMNVPAAGGVAIGRAAGFLDYREPDPRWGKPLHQVLVESYTVEGVDTLKRFTDPDGGGVLMDVENFGEGDDLWTGRIPRLDPPLRAYGPDALGGISGSVFPYPVPTGQHGFAFPGGQLDTLRERCARSCPEGEDCGCQDAVTFDVGMFMFNMLGGYLASAGTTLSDDLCNSRNDCPGKLAPPPPRR